jgi:hypothetical protein
MPGFVLSQAAVLVCPHGGKVTAVPASPQRAAFGGGLAVTVLDQLMVAGCANLPPCVRVQWANVAGRVLAGGVPVLLQAPPGPPPAPGNGLCAPTPVPPQVLAMQTRTVGS